MIHLRVFPTPLGPSGVAWRDGRVCAFELPGASGEETFQRLSHQVSWAGEEFVLSTTDGEELIERVRRHLDGQRDTFRDVPLDLTGLSDFALRVSGATRALDPGETITYGELAARCDQPGGARAVGRVMSKNRIPLIIPCHRVLGGDGELRGFSAKGGVRTKLRLLTVEGADLQKLSQAGPRALKRADPKLAAVIRSIGPYLLADEPREDAFVSLAQSIVHQQVSMAAGRSIFAKLLAAVGGRLTPDAVRSSSPDVLRGAGLSRQKTGYLQDLATHALEGSLPLDRISRMDDERVIESLTAVRGLGRWSAEMFLIFYLKRLDVLPVDDLGLRKGVLRLYTLPELPKPAQVRELGERWAPYRSLATWYLWRSLEAGGI